MKLQNQAQIVGGILVYGTVSWLLGVAGRSALLTKEAPGVGVMVLTIFAMVAIAFLLLACIALAQADFK